MSSWAWHSTICIVRVGPQYSFGPGLVGASHIVPEHCLGINIGQGYFQEAHCVFWRARDLNTEWMQALSHQLASVPEISPRHF